MSDYKYTVRDSPSHISFEVAIVRKNVSIMFDKTGQKPGIY